VFNSGFWNSANIGAPGGASFRNGYGAAFIDVTIKPRDRFGSIFRCVHFNKAEAAASAIRISDDLGITNRANVFENVPQHILGRRKWQVANEEFSHEER